MPPQMNGGRVSTFNPESDEFEDYLIKNDGFDSSADSESTCSTEIETSLSKDSLISQYDEIESPKCLRHRGHEMTCTFDDREVGELYLHSTNDEPRHRRINRLKSRAQKRWFVGALVLMLSLVGVALLRKPYHRARDVSQWLRFLDREASKVAKEIRKIPVGSTFTIRLKGSRIDLLRQSIDAVSQCPSVDEIQVDFDGSSDLPPVLYRYGAGKTTVVGSVPTAGAFLLKEGLVLSCKELDNAFETWKMDPNRFVGFLGHQNGGTKDINDFLTADITESLPMLSDRAAFVHRQYLEVFAPFAHDACCDTLLSVQVSLVSKMPPVLMRATPLQTFESRQSQVESDSASIEKVGSSCYSSCMKYMTRLGGLSSIPTLEASILLGSK